MGDNKPAQKSTKGKSSRVAYRAEDRRSKNKKRNIARDARLKEKAKLKKGRRLMRERRKVVEGIAQ